MKANVMEHVTAAPDVKIATIKPVSDGHAFVWYGDCCTGTTGQQNTMQFAAINAVFRRLDAWPDHVIFAGDNIMGGPVGADEHRRQWRHWLNDEMSWFFGRGVPMHQTPSNHNTFDPTAEMVFRETFPDIPQNGPDDQKGLSYWVRRGDLLLVFVNTNFSGLGGSGHVEHEWLDRVLSDQADAAHTVVIGHHPIFPVNGYAQHPGWRVVPEEGAAFWDVLVRHGVLAYLCSHLIAFDVQVQRGVLHILTGGAGTSGMKLGMMPGASEYFHLVQGAIDAHGLRYQTLDPDGVAREWLRWPEPGLDAGPSTAFDPASPPAAPDAEAWIATFRISGRRSQTSGAQTFVCGWQSWEGPEAIWIGAEGSPARLVVQLVPKAGLGAQRWLGPELSSDASFDLEIAIHSGMGPGGVLWRPSGGAWSSLLTTSAQGADQLAWPEQWALGHAQSGPTDRPFGGADLAVDWRIASHAHRDLFDEAHSHENHDARPEDHHQEANPFSDSTSSQ